MPRRKPIGQPCRQQQRKIRQQRVVAVRKFDAALVHCIEPRELRQTQRRVDIGQSIVETEHLLLVIPCAVGRTTHRRGITRQAVRAEHLKPTRKPAVVSCNDPALARRHDLHGMKAEDRNIGVRAADRRPVI